MDLPLGGNRDDHRPTHRRHDLDRDPAAEWMFANEDDAIGSADGTASEPLGVQALAQQNDLVRAETTSMLRRLSSDETLDRIHLAF